MRQDVLERAMKRQEVMLKAIGGEISWGQAAEILGLSTRQIRRLKTHHEIHGFRCLIDGRYGKKAWNRLPLDVTRKVLSLYREEYFDFNVKHFHEKLLSEHQIHQSYTWVKNILQEAGLVARSHQRTKHRKRRERQPLVGMMIHLDGSSHHWLGENGPKWDLLALLDDANNEVYEA